MECALFYSSTEPEWLYRAFLAAFAISENSLWPLSIYLEIEPPDTGRGASDAQPVEDFWRERWKNESWRVSGWELKLNVERGNR
jgi:hypothetical protein